MSDEEYEVGEFTTTSCLYTTLIVSECILEAKVHKKRKKLYWASVFFLFEECSVDVCLVNHSCSNSLCG